MTGYQSKRKAAQDKMDDDDAQKYIAEYEGTLDIAYEAGYYDGKKAALAGREWNFCERCGKRTADLTTIHTCTPPQENTQRPWVYLTDEHIKEIVGPYGDMPIKGYTRKLVDQIEAKSKELNT